MSQWREVQLFQSSSFRDMHGERDLMHSEILPALEEKCRNLRHYLLPTDLRWGVETVDYRKRLQSEYPELSEDEIERRTAVEVLGYCLSCLRRRDKQVVVAFLGDRYGWIPGAEMIRDALGEVEWTHSDLEGKSVTELEIEYGVFDESEETSHCQFFLRSIENIEDVPEELRRDLWTDPDSEEGKKLTALKERVKQKYPGRFHEYTVRWDSESETLILPDDLEETIVTTLWRELERAIRAQPPEPPKDWIEEENLALADFVAQRGDRFNGAGRLNLVGKLESLATDQDGPGGVVLTGAAGSGKSSVFARLHQSLEPARKNGSLLLLDHAFGLTRRSIAAVDVLRRWISLLARDLEMEVPLRSDLSAEDTSEMFWGLLHRCSARKRVVLLIDAINQMEPSLHARKFVWLPSKLPHNVRLIATAEVGGNDTEHANSLADALSNRCGIPVEALPPLHDDAGAILDDLCASEQKTINSEVRTALLSKPVSAGDDQLASGNPLWLTLAFAELSGLTWRDYRKEETEERYLKIEDDDRRRIQLLVDVTNELPGDVPFLYQRMLSRLEERVGAELVRAFSVLIGLSRSGWREIDLREWLAPFMANGVLDDYLFEKVRQSFRAHLITFRSRVEGSANQAMAGRFDFFHAQMRLAVESRYLEEPAECRAWHKYIVGWLKRLPEGDELRRREIVFHCIEANLGRETAEQLVWFLENDEQRKEYETVDISEDYTVTFSSSRTGADSALKGSVETVADFIRTKGDAAVEWFREMLLSDEISTLTRLNLAGFSSASLVDEFENEDAFEVCRVLLGAASAAYRMVLENHDDTIARHGLFFASIKLGDLYLAKGDLSAAKTSYDRSLSEISILVDEHGALADNFYYDMTNALCKLGDLAMRVGEAGTAGEHYQRALEISRALAERASPDDTRLRLGLVANLQKIGRFERLMGSAERARQYYMEAYETLASNREGLESHWCDALTELGEIEVEANHLAAAQGWFKKSLEAARTQSERLGQSDAHAQRDLSIALCNVGRVARLLGDDAEARLYYEEDLAVNRSLAAMLGPSHVRAQRDVSVSLNNLGNLEMSQGRASEASLYYHEAMEIRTGLAERGPDDVRSQRDLAASLTRLASLKSESPENRIEWIERAVDIHEGLLEKSPGSAEFTVDAAIARWNAVQFCGTLGAGQRIGKHSARCHELIRAIRESDMWEAPGMEALHQQFLMIEEAVADAAAAETDGTTIEERLRAAEEARQKGEIARESALLESAFIESMRLFQEQPRDLRIGNLASYSATQIADLLERSGRMEKAEQYYRKALDVDILRHQVLPGDERLEADFSNSLFDLAKHLALNGAEQNAETKDLIVAATAIELERQQKNQSDMSICHNLITRAHLAATICAKQGECEDAEAYLELVYNVLAGLRDCGAPLSEQEEALWRQLNGEE